MASLEHIELSTYIKNVHNSLRSNFKKMGFESAWQMHCEDDKVLEEYAQAMKKLATEFWDKNAEVDYKVISRITWVYENIKKYFSKDLLKQRQREIDVLLQMEVQLKLFNYTKYDSNQKLNILDVGSCYNPFKIYDNYNVIPIDIAPSTEDVFKCDFLSVKTNSDNTFLNRNIISLKKEYYHVVIFSLLLEYIPSPEKRLECCIKAYDLLDNEGILVIITPDSKHVGANAKYMKSWRFALSLIGFSRIKYEKLPYIHCMTFRKCINDNFSKRWAKMHENDGFETNISIPQDYTENFEKD